MSSNGFYSYVRPSTLHIIQGAINVAEGVALSCHPDLAIQSSVTSQIGQVQTAYRLLGIPMIALGHYHIVASTNDDEKFMKNSVLNRLLVCGLTGLLKYMGNDVPKVILYATIVDAVFALGSYAVADQAARPRHPRND
ncbi:5932_t:CDS:2 [Paraglomus occultum]|uniref:5932_t:CDS:1 n=1 Tax=Paraglomus occultum TaxID=144539 RepID=A0A9N9FMJ8_9GLOM|nr:5932_t:CDS:2 [Paraglomus occultum]